MNPLTRFSRFIRSSVLNPLTTRQHFSTSTRDSPFDHYVTGRDFYPYDRLPANRDEVLRDALQAWRDNPLARRAVELPTEYIIGAGLTVECPEHEPTNAFLQKWWNHPENHMTTRVYELSDELTRSGELFIPLSTDYAGMTYIRAIPAANVLEIITNPWDTEQEWEMHERLGYDSPWLAEESNGMFGRAWPIHRPEHDTPDEYGIFPRSIIHYAVNRAVGGIHGESDIAPVTRWLVRYAAWLEDRVRLNRFRNLFLFFVKGKYRDAAERTTRQETLNANPPTSGSIMVGDESETWEVLSPKLESHEAGEDGLAIKKMVAAGTGNPLHFFAEPESSTRTTAESAGGPTFRRYEQRQRFFISFLQELATIAVRRRAMFDHHVSPRAEIIIKAGDITGRDNAALANSANAIYAVFSALRDRGLIDDPEVLRMVYRFSGESVNITQMLERGKAAPPPKTPEKSPGKSTSVDTFKAEGAKIDPETGDIVNVRSG